MRVGTQRTDTTCHCPSLAPGARASVSRPYDLVLDAVQLEELERLRVVPRRHLDLLPALRQEGDERPEEEHPGRARDGDPDAHQVTLACGDGSGSRMDELQPA